MLTSNISSLTLLCHCNIKIWLVESKPIRSNATIPTSLLCVLCHHKFLMIRGNDYFLHKWHQVPCVMSSIIPSLSTMRGLTALNGSIYLYLPTFFKLNVCCHDRYLQKHPANFQRFLTTFQRLPNGAENIRRCSEDGLTGCKESHFYNLPFGQVEANIE